MKIVSPKLQRYAIKPINQSIHEYEYASLEQKIKKIKYPTYAISQAQSLQHKVNTFKSDIVIQQLTKQFTNLNSYRKVRGDGNCFFRALAFSYLTIVADPCFQLCFSQIKQINLTSCYPDSIPSEFKMFYDHKFLIYVFMENWTHVYTKFLRQNNQNPRKALIKVFDLYPFLDFIVILYFRALCLKEFKKQEENLKDFLLGKQQESIRTYSQQTQGILIDICSTMMKFQIFVYEIRKDIVKIYSYDSVKEKIGSIHLLFYENHYDIVEKNGQIEEEKNYLSIRDHYSDVSEKMVVEKCVSCGIRGLVYEDSLTCQRCYQMISNAQKKYQNGKLIRARCAECRYVREDVSEAFGLCKGCMNYQSYIENKRMEMVEEQEKKKRIEEQQKSIRKEEKSKEQKQVGGEIEEKQGKEVNEEKEKAERKQEEQKTRPIIGTCWQCQFKNQELDPITRLCSYCTRNQKIVLNRLEKRQESLQKYKQNLHRMKSPRAKIQKEEEERDRGRNDEYYNRFELKGTMPEIKSPKNAGIKQKIDQIQVRNVGKKLTQVELLQKKPKKICERCKRQVSQLHETTPICKQCYRRTFTQLNYCKKCKHKYMLHQQSVKCQECHFQDLKSQKLKEVTHANILKQTSRACRLCKTIGRLTTEGFCQKCFTQNYCRTCKKVSSPITSLVDGQCINCRCKILTTKTNPQITKQSYNRNSYFYRKT